MKKPNLDEIYSAYKNGTLKEYCEIHDLDYVLLNLVMREWPNAIAHSIIGNTDRDNIDEKT